MSREIKFRVVRKEENGWKVYAASSIIDLWNAGGNTSYGSMQKELTYYEKGELIFMQYTGLKDKNGKEIYEGDIIKILIWKNYGFGGKHATKIKAKIEFQSGGFWFTGEGHTDCNWHFYNESEREIIGNIYETPELITQPKTA